MRENKNAHPWLYFDLARGSDTKKELDRVAQLIQDRLTGKLHPERFKSFRLNYGIYGVRKHEDGMHMLRIKVPGGFLFADQIRTLAKAAKLYAGSGVAHITTRQDMQLHYVKLEDISELLHLLDSVGLTTREACGNTVRNVTCSPYTGICPEQAFDVLPFAIYASRSLLRHPISATLPRKFKISFSECEQDHALSRIHDVGAIAQIKDGKKGFRLYVGGGLSYSPIPSQLFYDFLPVEDFYPFVEALLRVFHRYERGRKNRQKARLKFLLASLGMEKFKAEVEAAFSVTRRYRRVDDDLATFLNAFPVSAPTSNGRANAQSNQKRKATPTHPLPKEDPAFESFQSFSLHPQKQEGFYAVEIKPPLGNLTPTELEALAHLSEAYGEGHLQVTIQQNIVLPWIKQAFLYDLYLDLKAQGLYDERFGMRQIVSCPGAYSCRLAVTHPYNLAEFIGSQMNDFGGLRIHISGCPNSCGHHHVGDIGFYGASLRVGEKLVPHYVLLLGGDPFHQRPQLAQPIAKIPAQHVPQVVAAIVRFWKENRQGSELFFEMIDRVGLDPLRRCIAPFTKVTESEAQYSEPGIEEEFKMEAESRGECAGSMLDVVATDLFVAQRNLYECEEHLQEEAWEKVKEKCLASLAGCCTMFVSLRKGKSPEVPLDTILQFEEEIVPEDWLCHDFSGVTEQYLMFRDAPAEKENVEKLFAYTSTFVKDCDDAFLRIKPDMQIAECTEKIIGSFS